MKSEAFIGRDGPAYRVLAEMLREDIEQGTYGVGDRLPTEVELSREHGLSRPTVRRAFIDLVAAGLVERVRGRGTFVRSSRNQSLRHVGSVEDLIGLPGETDLRVVAPLHRVIDINAAGRLRLTDDVVYVVGLVRSQNGVDFGHTAVHVPPTIAAYLADVEALVTPGGTPTATVLALLDSRLEVPVTRVEQSITAVRSDDSGVREVFGGAASEPLLRVDRVFLQSDGAPIELAISHYLPSQYTHRVRLERG